MEARALVDFDASSDDELSFKRGSVLKIQNPREDKNWYKAEQDGREGFVPVNYFNYIPTRWYVGTMRKPVVENFLLKRDQEGRFIQPEGAFVVTHCEAGNDFTLFVKSCDKVQDFKVQQDGAGRYFLWIVKFDSLNEMVEYHRASSVSTTEILYLKDTDDTLEWACAEYDFTAQESGELSFKRDDVLQVLSEYEGSEWWLCSLEGQQGQVPANYLKKF